MSETKTTLFESVYKKYKSDLFLETGSWMGDGIQMALDCKTKKVISIEIMQPYYTNCSERFEAEIKNGNVELHLGHSADVLQKILPSITDKITFWLDAHLDLSHIHPDINTHSPLMHELDIIQNFSTRNDNTIMIDDIRIFKARTDWAIRNFYDVKGIENKLMEINPNYKIVYEEGFSGKTDVLVAFVEN
jgi:hypothetical protein